MNSTPAAVLDGVAEAFVARCRTGEEPDWQDYAADHPELAAEMEAIFPLMQLVDGAVSNRLTEQGGAGDETLPTLSREVVGDYQIIGEIGRGGMGAVYEAEQISLRRRVALKVQSHGHTSGGKSDKRFRQEAQAAAQLVHPNIVPVYDVGEDGEFAYYAMQLIEGQPLDEFIDDVRRLRRKSRDKGLESRAGEEKRAERREERAADGFPSGTNGFDSVSPSGASGRGYFHFVARFGAQVADAVAFAHARGIIHRDIKPSNLLLDRDLAAWVTDFGLAKIADSKLTQTGDVLGTVRYMAPEQFRGWSDSKSDAYSLGATLYELLALRPPYQGPDRIALIRKIATDEPERLRKLEPRVPRDLETIIHKSLSKEPAGRYQSAADFRDDLRRFLDSKPIHARHDSLMYLTRKTVHRYRAALLATVLIVVSLVIGLVGMSIAWKREAESAAENGELAQSNAKLNARLIRELYLADMRDAFRAYQNGRPDEAQRILQQYIPQPGQPDLRGVEWRMLDRLTASLVPRALRGHKGPVNELAIVPGRPWIVSVGEDGTLRIWHDKTGECLQTIPARGHPLHAVAVSPDGMYVAAGDRHPGEDDPCKAWLWELDTGNLVRELHEVPCTVESLAFSPDARNIAIGERYEYVWLVSVDTGELVDRQYTRARHKRLLFTSDGKNLICPAKVPNEFDPRGLSVMQVWDADLKETKRQFDFGKPQSMALSSDERWLATTSEDSTKIQMFGFRQGETVSSVDVPGGRLGPLAFSPDDRLLAVAQFDGMVRLWQVTSRQYDEEALQTLTSIDEIGLTNPRSFLAHEGGTYSIDFTHDGQLVTCGADGLVKVWPLAELYPNWTGPTRVWPAGIAVSPTGQQIAATELPGHGANVWANSSVGRAPWHQLECPLLPTVIEFSPNGERLAVGTQIGEIVLLSTHDWECAQTLQSGAAHVNHLAFSPTGKYLAIANNDHTTRIWRIADGEVLHTLHHENDPTYVAFSDDGRLAVAGEFPQIEIYSIETGRMTGSLPVRKTWSLDWSPDGKSMASGQENGDLFIWQIDGQPTPTKLGNHNGQIHVNVRFLDDGTRLATASGGTIRLWHVPTARELGILYEAEADGPVMDIAVARDGSRLYASISGTTYEHNIGVWPLR